MAQSATINVNSFLNTNSDANSVSKSCADNSSDFANVFEDVNKSYTTKDKETSDNKVVTTIDNKQLKSDNSENKISSTDEKAAADKTNNTDAKDKTKTLDELEKKVKMTNEEIAKLEKIAIQTEEVKSKIAGLKKEKEESDAKILEMKKNDSAVNPEGLNASSGTENVLKSLNNVETATIEQNQVIQKNINAGLAHITKDLKDLDNITTNKSDNIKVQTQAQTQTQQVLSNLKINQEENSSQAVPTTISSQMPKIEVGPQAVVVNNEVNVTTKPVAKDILDKASLTQDMLNKTNAKVVNIETSNSNSDSNNLLNKQNPQEQVIKLALESNNATHSGNVNAGVDLSNIADTTLQANFEKTLNTVQTQTQAQAHESKELTNSDILSQINSKLDNLKTEGLTKISIILKPENLGKINLELINSKDGLVAQMTTDNPQVKELLNKSLEGLKESLSSQGVNVNSVTVKVEEVQKQSSDMFSFEGKQSNHGNQGFSDNPNKSNKGGAQFDEDINNLGELQIGEADDLISVGSHVGEVDYKV